MSTTGVVKNWNRGYGFAEAATGEVVWIHRGVLPDGHKLKPGETVFFDMEPVEGHGGRVKGTNVSGPGIVAAGEKLSKEEMLQEKKEWAEFKKEKLGPMSDAPPKAKKEKPMRKPGTKSGPRVAGGGGAGVANDEKRIDPADGQAYTKQDFVACYSGLKEWNAAKPVSPPKGRGRGAAAAPYNANAKRGRGGIVSRPNGAGSGKPLGRAAGGGGRKGGRGGGRSGGRGRR